MLKIDNKRAQAVAELAVFGAVLIFVLGTIVRSAVGNGYEQNQSFKAMRMAMLASWKASEAGNTNRTSASVLYVEDRLSADSTKYGDLDRDPFVASGSGTFSFEMLYPMDPDEVKAMLPMMDIYINGQHFPLTTASYVQNQEISKPAACPLPSADNCASACNCTSLTDLACQSACQQCQGEQCSISQCLRNNREWVGGIVYRDQFGAIIPVSPKSCDVNGQNCGTAATIDALDEINATNIYNFLVSPTVGVIIPNPSSTLPFQGTVATATLSASVIQAYKNEFAGTDQDAQISQIEKILTTDQTHYKLFYSMGVNGTSQFSVTPPACLSHPCKDLELSSDLVLPNNGSDPSHPTTSNADGDLMFDLRRMGLTNAQIEGFPSAANPSPPAVPLDLRPYMAWEWTATAGTSSDMIGLDVNNNQYPQYDIDGRLKVVTIYGISQASNGDPIVTYEDFQHGDIDATWDANSCGPKPGLQNNSQIFSFTKNGTYLLVRDGKLFNHETDQFVRSVNQRDSIDLIQRSIQLSANTGNFCQAYSPNGQLGYTCNTTQGCPIATATTLDGGANPVEICVDSSAGGPNCFTSANVGQTCYDINPAQNIIYVRSRLEDRRGHFWMTDTQGQLKVN